MLKKSQIRRLSDIANSKARSLDKINEHYAVLNGEAWLPRGQQKIKQVIIEDLPILITADGTIVCIPKTPEMQVTALLGLTGSGKTLSAGNILDELYWHWGDNICNINDSQDETLAWSEVQDNAQFIYKNRILNQNPVPLPVVYIFPNSENFQIKENLTKYKNSVVVSMPFREVIENMQKYFGDLKESKKYLDDKKKELLEAQSEEELFDVIESINTGESASDGMKNVVNKLSALFRTLLDEGILNLSDMNIPSELRISSYILPDGKHLSPAGYRGNPFTTIMLAEGVPSFITSDLYTQKYKDAVFSYYISEMFKESLAGVMKGKRVWIYCDELTRLVNTEEKYNSPYTEVQLNNVAQRGRNNGISLIYATQEYKKIPQPIRKMTQNAIVFRHKSKDETKEICDDFGVDKPTQDKILSLKKFEAILFTTQYLVCYKDNRCWVHQGADGPLKGTIFPSLHRNRFLQKKELEK